MASAKRRTVFYAGFDREDIIVPPEADLSDSK